MLDNCTNIFIDGTFFSAPIGVYQIIVLRVALENHHKYFTTSFALALDKKEETYKEILNKINNNIKTYALKHNLKLNYKPKNIHCDMELSLINSIKYMWPYSKIKICYFHWKQAMENQRKKYKDILKNSLANQETFKCLLTLPLIPTDMVELIFKEIRNNNHDFELNELFDYFEKIYINKFKPELWNYFKLENNRTNNACESYNKTLNSYFATKPTIIKLINILSLEENLLREEYTGIINEGFISKRKRLGPNDYFCCLPYFIEKENELKGDTDSIRKKRIDIWMEAVKRLPIN